MRVTEAIAILQAIEQEHGDVDLMFRDGDGSDVWEVNTIELKVAEEDEYPEDYHMPEGTEFVLIES